MGVFVYQSFFSFNPVFGQRDGSDCGKAIELPAPAEICKRDDYHLKEREKWFEFTANAPELKIELDKLVTDPIPEIKKIFLYEHECPTPTCNYYKIINNATIF